MLTFRLIEICVVDNVITCSPPLSCSSFLDFILSIYLLYPENFVKGRNKLMYFWNNITLPFTSTKQNDIYF